MYTRRGCTSTPLEQTRPQPSSPAVIALHFALLKPKRLAQLVEKATELGVTQLQPLVTSRTAVRSISIEKLRAIVIEAAEQCGRLSVPEVFDLNEDLESCLRAARATAGAAVFACDERPGCTNRLDQALARAATDGLHAAAFVVGPEGGFDPSEFEALRVHAELVSLGPNVLRAETAAMSALAVMHCRL
ncbi:ribosomal RNA small subunit methyltransferase E [Pavlovales sp. CCMP2436]|nr:ribosomal RNA small subunit methyltransferase E [Pavlovales sp. CCMP2436]|mmetsp:Transcript_24401/g.56470  ORF Transcript_24401/g.56470 Transcript_24401/m.56470 type:complete len:189 (+) Transcript_24401:379-945(+)